MITQPLGAHMSIGKGFAHMIADAESINCTAIQFFLHSNRQWHMPDIQEDKIEEFKKASKASSIQSYQAHASYLINLGSAQAEIRKKSIAILIKELHYCDLLGVPYLVLHPGSFVGSDRATSLKRTVENLNEVLSKTKKTMILIENMAGQGSILGSTLEELEQMRSAVENKKRIGICFDTCHGFSAGYDFATSKGYTSFWKSFDQVIGIEHLKAFHINDSKRELGAHVDRHENIGKGTMGLEPFRLILNDNRFKLLPKVLETPYDKKKHNALSLYEKNLILLRSLIKK